MLEHCKDLVKGVRNVRTEMDVPPSRKAKIFIVADDAALRETFEKTREAYQNLAGASDVSVQADKNGIEDDAVSVVIPGATLSVSYTHLGTGDPMRSSMTLIMFLNKHLYSKNYGMAGALSVVLFFITGVLSLVVFKAVSYTHLL